MILNSHWLKIAITGVAATVIASCSNVYEGDDFNSPNASPKADAELIMHDVRMLSADDMEGRKPGTSGYQKAAQYVAARYDDLGLRSITPNYRQLVSLREARLVRDTVAMSLDIGKGFTELTPFVDFAVSASKDAADVNVDAHMVFVGAGLSAERFDVDDLGGVDLSGKVAVVVSGTPKDWPSEERAHLGSRSRQLMLLQQAGAVGVVYLSTPRWASYFDKGRAERNASRPSTYWLDGSNQPMGGRGTLPTLLLNSEQSAALLESMGVEDTAAFLSAVHTGDANTFKGQVVGHARWQSQSTFKNYQSPNVLGFLPGRDPSLSPVLLTAHLDHLGKDDDGHIYNGAMDNASGVAIMLEVARMFQRLPQRPKRGVVFAALTAEEMGLLGAEYLANVRPKAMQQIAANVNIDMPILTFESTDLIPFGSQHSSMDSTVERGINRAGLAMQRTDPWPEQTLFLRSDHYPFVKAGIPSVFLVTGQTAVDPEIDGNAVAEGFLKEHYHRVSDNLELDWSMPAVVNFAQANFEIARELANEPKAPQWNADSLFFQPVTAK